MPLAKRGNAPVVEQPTAGVVTTSDTAPVVTPKSPAKKHLSKEEYWDRKEERDIQRDKDMAWSGLAQAALNSVGLIQLNRDNTLEGLVALVAKTTDLLLRERDKRNG